MTATRPKPRRPRLVKAPVETAAEVLGRLEPGVRICGLTKGQFSLLDLLRAVLDQTGPAEVVVSTWTTGIRDAETAAWLLETGTIRSFCLLTDRSFPSRQPDYCRRVVELFGAESICCTRTHAKFAIIRNERWNVVIRSSMNLNRNPRFEQFDLDDDAEMAAWFAELVGELRAAGTGADFTTREVDQTFAGAMGGGCALPLTNEDVEPPMERMRRAIAEHRREMDARRRA